MPRGPSQTPVCLLLPHVPHVPRSLAPSLYPSPPRPSSPFFPRSLPSLPRSLPRFHPPARASGGPAGAAPRRPSCATSRTPPHTPRAPPAPRPVQPPRHCPGSLTPAYPPSPPPPHFKHMDLARSSGPDLHQTRGPARAPRSLQTPWFLPR